MKHFPDTGWWRRGAGLALLLALARPGLAQTLPPAWPDQPLAVTACAPTQALPGARVVVRGQGFAGVSSVRFNGIEAEEFEINSLTQLTATVPARASSGLVSVSTAAGTARTTQPLEVPPEVVVQDAQTLRGTYARLVVGPVGTATLGGPVLVLGTLVVQPGSFVLASGATLCLSQPAGLAATGPRGGVQTTVRSFSPEASYVYGGWQPGSETGSGLPTCVRGLSVTNPTGLMLTGPLAVSHVLCLAGPLITNKHALTLLATPSLGPALLLGSGKVHGAIRVQPAAEATGEPVATSLATTAP